ncbi:MAG: hypothetical protein K8R31_13740 [Bacteroidales bacterium]|nr:hypothetical protein [Bacteroidales bacterium]
MRKYIILFSFFLVASVNTWAQVDDNLDELKSAYLNVQEGNYKEAYPYFKEMLNIYPKEPTYNYYVGVCLLFLDKDPLLSIKYLRFAATKEVPDDVYYYLGLAYIKNYQFEKAVENLEWFEKKAGKKQLKELNVQNYIAMAQNGSYLIKYIKEPSVYSKTIIDQNDFYKNYKFDDLEGKFVDRFEYFNQEKDSLVENSILYVPNFLKKNEILYFSAKNKKRGDYDIYRITRLTDTSWSEPENLGNVINTSFDENYPYLHSDGTTLYFASKGHYSMGGYDLFSSSWNWDNQEWPEPENLDFPINSPFNDILFVSSPNKKTAFFTSDRETKEPNVIVYKLKLNNSEPYIELKNHEEVLELSRLSVNIVPEESKKREYADERIVSGQHEFIKIKNEGAFLYKSEYDSLLSLAINYQLKADSLGWIIDEKRLVFDYTEDGQERAKLSNTIIEFEREIYLLQKKADSCYERVREIEQANLASQKSIYEDLQTTKNKEISNTEEELNKSKNIYVEPVQDSLSISKLKIIEETQEEVTKFSDYGLRIEIPSNYNSVNPIPVNESLPNGILYMIQLGAFSTPKTPGVFKGLTPLSCIKKENSNLRKYFAGKFLQLSEAQKNLPLVKSKSFKDAYIVAFNNGNIIPVKNAVKLESGKDKLPNVELTEGLEGNSQTADDLSIIYILKGQISLKDSLFVDRVKNEIPEKAELYLENKVDIMIFTIKSFSSYDEAYAIKSKLELIVKKEIEIHAYFAENQIPLEQARKITK